MEENYSDEHQRKGKTDYEFLLDRIRHYIGPFRTYFELNRKLKENELQEEKIEGIKEIINNLEEICEKNIEKILELIKEK